MGAARFRLHRWFALIRFHTDPQYVERLLPMHPRGVFPLFALGLVAFFLPTLATADDKAVKDELKRQAGTWAATSSIYEGQEAPDGSGPLDQADRRGRPCGLGA